MEVRSILGITWPDTTVLVTHHARHHPEKGVWLSLGFVTMIVSDPERYFFGFEFSHPFTVDQIEERTDKGFLVALDQPQSINGDQELWLSEEGDVWLAVGPQPRDDPDRFLI